MGRWERGGRGEGDRREKGGEERGGEGYLREWYPDGERGWGKWLEMQEWVQAMACWLSITLLLIICFVFCPCQLQDKGPELCPPPPHQAL